MTKELWINLPVKNVKATKEFFTKLGFSFDTKYGNTDHSAGMLVGSKNIVVMFFEETMFKMFTQNNPTDTKFGTEVLFSFDAESRGEVDEMAKKVLAAGGTIYSEPAEVQGWMYGFGLIDLDGHRWNMLHMDMSKMPQVN